MLAVRVMPCLLKQGDSLVKTIGFQNPQYIGDPTNTIQIFNNLAVDELILLDITATNEQRSPSFDFISQVSSECFMPLAYGGGIRTVDEVKRILSLGTEKVVLCTAAYENPALVRDASQRFGSQSIIVSVDVKKSSRGAYEVYTHAGTKNTGVEPVEYARQVEKLGAGEIFLNSIDRDGMMTGYDLALIKHVARSVTLPLVACGGAGTTDHLRDAVGAGASATAAGSLFVYQNSNRSVLINFPTQPELRELFMQRNEA